MVHDSAPRLWAESSPGRRFMIDDQRDQASERFQGVGIALAPLFPGAADSKGTRGLHPSMHPLRRSEPGTQELLGPQGPQEPQATAEHRANRDTL